ncbi:MAG: hypothetical protein O2897_00790 [bacterium]|nr:hypothetical protein [bacterium]
MLRIIILFIFGLLQIGCLGRSSAVTCERPIQEVTNAKKEFILRKEGGSFVFQDWTFSVAAGVLKFDAYLQVEDRAGSDLGVKLPHVFETQSGVNISVVNHHPPSSIITPIYVSALKPIEYINDTGRIIATLNSGGLPAHSLTVMNNANQLAEPDFSKVPTSINKSYTVSPIGSGWFYVLANSYENTDQCLDNTINEIAAQIGDTIGQYVDDPCAACRTITDVVGNLSQCRDLVANLDSILCDAFTAEREKDSWTWSTLNYGCQGATWLGSWVVDYAAELVSGSSATDAICDNADSFKAFLESYNLHADCMCDLFLRDPRCTLPESDAAKCTTILESIGVTK